MGRLKVHFFKDYPEPVLVITHPASEKTIECRDRLGGLLKYYHRKAA